jgi:hypothetical protein
LNKLRLILILSFAIVLTGCSDDNKAWEPYSPLNTTSLMKQYASSSDYEQFKTLLLEGYDEESMNEMYGTVKKAVTDTASIDTFTLVSFENGKSLLVYLTPNESEDGEVLIQDIIELPTEMATYIEEELNKK